MTTSPYMPMYWADYDTDTGALSIAEHGLYLMLIRLYWQKGGPIEIHDRLWKEAKCDTPDEWSSNAQAVLALFQEKGGKLHHKRIDAELASFRQKSEKRRAAGRKGGQASGNKQQSAKQMLPDTGKQCSSNAQAMPKHTDTDTDIDIERQNPRKRGSPIPDGFPGEVELDWGVANEALPKALLKREAEKFREHWQSPDAKNRLKKDWPAAWRKWVRNAKDWGPTGQGKAGAKTEFQPRQSVRPPTPDEIEWARQAEAARQKQQAELRERRKAQEASK